MKDKELISLWKQQESKIDQLMSINSKLLQNQLTQKANKALFGMKAEKVLGIVLGTFYLLFLGFLLVVGLKATGFNPDFFVVSVGSILLVNLKVYIDYIRHLVYLNQIDFEGTVSEIQDRLLKIKFSLIKSTRIVVLQIPFYTTFHLSINWFPGQADPTWILIQSCITGLFMIISIAAFWYITPKNADKKWVKWLISSAGGTQIEESLEHLKELEDLKLQ